MKDSFFLISGLSACVRPRYCNNPSANMKTSPVTLFLFTLFILFSPLAVRAAAPVVSNVRSAQLAGTKNVEVLYDVSDAEGDALSIGMQVSGDAGQTYTIPATALSGHIGAGVAPGVNRRIVWNAGADWNGQLVSSAKVRVTASDGTTPAPPPGMVYIPAGVFQMGDNFNEIGADTLPVHNVYVSGFFMDRFETTKELWLSVMTWAQGNGYSIPSGSYFANGHPARQMTWYDAVKWCNARSEKEGLTPCYYIDTAQTNVYRNQGAIDITNAMVKWTANGYRLPTEAEWEKAARGGSLGLRYPWGNTINGSQANYQYSGDTFDNGTTPVGYYNGSQSPAGVDMANGYGLYDMAGNVAEWCWDWYGGTYYGDATANNDPHGPSAGPYRIIRGGLWVDGTTWLRNGTRTYPAAPSYSGAGYFGLRCMRTP
jgi:formylglycine-generating enzyme required for sulfatase activity